MNHQILIINLNDDSQSSVVSALGDENKYTHVKNLKQAYNKLLKMAFDVVILEPRLKNESGFDLFLKLQDFNLNLETPIIVTSDNDNIADLVHAFSLGAEDYVKVPFNPLEFRARVESRINKHKKKTNFFKTDGLLIDLGFQKVFKKNKQKQTDLELTPIEFKILFALIKSKGKPLKREDLIHTLWSKDQQFDSRSIDAHISNLRKKLGSHSKIVGSVYGVGYVYRPLLSSNTTSMIY